MHVPGGGVGEGQGCNFEKWWTSQDGIERDQREENEGMMLGYLVQAISGLSRIQLPSSIQEGRILLMPLSQLDAMILCLGTRNFCIFA
jgi:hypothetical protein